MPARWSDQMVSRVEIACDNLAVMSESFAHGL